MSEVEGKRLERPTFTPYRDDPFEAEKRGVKKSAVIKGFREAEVCPVCGTKIIHESGCVRCTACGWSRC